MKTVILCPFGIRSSSAETCFQLSDALVRQGFEAELWLMTEADMATLRDLIQSGKNLSNIRFDLPDRGEAATDFFMYRMNGFRAYEPSEAVEFVVPETYAWALPLFVSQRVLLWWRGIDSAFRALGEINSNYLRMPNVRHAWQSAYAARFVRALGLDGTELGDYSVADPRTAGTAQADRPKCIALNANQDVVVNLDVLSRAITERCPYAQLVRIFDMNKSEVFSALRNARVFVDLGHFPGREHMARDAVALGASLVVSNAGSAACAEDFPLPEMYRVRPLDVDHIAALSVHMLEHPEVHEPNFAEFRRAIGREREVFWRQVTSTFSRYLS